MRNRNLLIAIAGGIICILIIGGVIFANRMKTQTNSYTSTNTPTVTENPTNTPSTSQMGTPIASPSYISNVKVDSFTIHANDDSADLTSVKVKAGDTVKITFSVDNQGTYHGGLNFVAPNSNETSGPIATGTSKTVTFTATKSFTYTPYWYTTNVQKPYNINVVVS